MGTIQSAESRTFEQRFGKTCPFCGKGWGDPSRCDPIGAELQWRESNRQLFVRVEYPERSCVVCLSLFKPLVHNRSTCSAECATVHTRRRNNERSRRRNKAKWQKEKERRQAMVVA